MIGTAGRAAGGSDQRRTRHGHYARRGGQRHAAGTAGAPPADQVKVEALSGLRNLGIRARDAERLLRDAAGATVQDLVRQALRGYAPQCREPVVAYAAG